MANVPFIQLSDGNRMPAIGLGTCAVSQYTQFTSIWCDKTEINGSILLIGISFNFHFLSTHEQSNGNEIEKAVKDAIDVGYRHIDTAWAYENEFSIGKAVRSKIADGTIERNDIFIVTKVRNKKEWSGDGTITHWPINNRSNRDTFSSIYLQLWNTFHEPHQVERACRQSLNNLQLDYIDLYLIHFPFGYVHKNDHEQWPRNADGSRALR